jgi:DNA-binding response OmpR family regulator
MGAGLGAVQALVVEDDSLIALVVEDALAALGFHNIHLARDLTKGWALADQVSPAFAILDVNIGRELVFPLAQELSRRKIPFLFSTGNARSAMPKEWQGHIIVHKPLQEAALARALRAIGVLPPLGEVPVCAELHQM